MGDSSFVSKIKCMADVLIPVYSIADNGEPSRTVQHNVAKVNMQFPQFEVTMADKTRIQPRLSRRDFLTSRPRVVAGVVLNAGRQRLHWWGCHDWSVRSDRGLGFTIAGQKIAPTDLVHNFSAAGHDS